MYYSWCMTSTNIVKWRKNEWLWKFWKRNDLYENFEKRGGGSREKGGGGNEIHAPCACGLTPKRKKIIYFFLQFHTEYTNPAGFTKLHMGLVVLVRKMSFLIKFLLQNTNLVSVLSKICPNFAGRVWQDWHISRTLLNRYIFVMLELFRHCFVMYESIINFR